MHGPETEFAQYIHRQKYQSNQETYSDSKNRVASTLTESSAHYHAFRDLLLTQSFLVGGRIAANLGKARKCTALNCFVSPVIDDTFCGENNTSPTSIMGVGMKLAATLRAGGGVGTDWSTIRPKGDLIKGISAPASGPTSFMQIFDSICKSVVSGGNRRGAMMFMLRVDHPDVERFVSAKHDETSLTTANMSVSVTDSFMNALIDGRDFPLQFNGKIYSKINPQHLWEQIMRSTWTFSEPGVIFIDSINKMNNLWYAEECIAVNPCGEIPLPANGACLLGSFNLCRYVKEDRTFDHEKLRRDVPVVIHALDRVIEESEYPHPEQQDEMVSKRRMGVGITGLANCVERMGHPYGSQGFIQHLREIMTTLRDEVYRASIHLAQERGSFPLFDRDKYLEGRFIKRLPNDIQSDIYKHGIRNSHLLAIAPTGTISLSCDNVSSSIEPVFAKSIKRTYLDGDDVKETIIEDYGVRVWGTEPKTAERVSADEHLRVLSHAQYHIDQACSKTVNMDSTMPWEDFKSLYMRAWRLGCKGLSTFNKDGKRMGILKSKDDEDDSEAKACRIDPETGIRTCDA